MKAKDQPRFVQQAGFICVKLFIKKKLATLFAAFEGNIKGAENVLSSSDDFAVEGGSVYQNRNKNIRNIFFYKFDDFQDFLLIICKSRIMNGKFRNTLVLKV